MRSSKSRSRSNKNRNNNRSVGNVISRVFDSSGPDGKVRGTPQQIIEKYNQLARDAQLANDRVAAENFQQHAEHYTRLLAEAQREMDQRREVQERENRERQAQRDRDRQSRGDGADDAVSDDSDLLSATYESDEQPVIDSMPILDQDFVARPRRRVEKQDSDLAEETPAATEDTGAQDKARKPRAPRKKKPAAQAEESPDAPEAAE